MTKPLRILMVCHMPWDRNLGGPRVQVELADEFRSAGHAVDKYSLEDAFPGGRSRLAEGLDALGFSRRARAFVRAHGAGYDVIDAYQGNLPYSKADLNFPGLLVARSVGLDAFYAAFLREVAARWPAGHRGSLAGRALRAWKGWRIAPSSSASFRAADLVNVCNPDEGAHVRDILGMGEKCVVLPFGMSTDRRGSFLRERQPAESRLSGQTIAFIGFWAPRKGSFDWGDVVHRVWSTRPATRFSFLGTGRGPDVVRADLGIGPDDRVTIIPSYGTDDLPVLLRGATLGAFPSYIEGFPFGVLELLAAGLPTVTYDVPGCRELPGRVRSDWLTKPGDTAGFADRLLGLLAADPGEYQRMSEACAEVADEFTWARIARDTLSAYRRRLESLADGERDGRCWGAFAPASSTNSEDVT